MDGETFADQRVMIEEVAQVDDRPAAHDCRAGPGVECTELLPLRGDHHAVRPSARLLRRAAEFNARQKVPGVFHALRIVDPDGYPGLLEAIDERQRRRFPNVVRIGLERQTEHGDDGRDRSFTLQGLENPSRHRVLAQIVGPNGAGNDVELDAEIFGRLQHGVAILREARSAVAWTRAKESRANTAVQPHACCHLGHVCIDRLAEIGNFVDEGDLRRQEAIRGVFHQFRTAPRNGKKRRAALGERSIDPGEHLARPLVIGSDDDTVRRHEVADRTAFPQKLRIGCHRHHVARVRVHDRFDPIAGSHGNRRLADDHRRAFQPGH